MTSERIRHPAHRRGPHDRRHSLRPSPGPRRAATAGGVGGAGRADDGDRHAPRGPDIQGEQPPLSGRPLRHSDRCGGGVRGGPSTAQSGSAGGIRHGSALRPAEAVRGTSARPGPDRRLLHDRGRCGLPSWSGSSWPARSSGG